MFLRAVLNNDETGAPGADNQIFTRNLTLGNHVGGIIISGKNNQVLNNTLAFNAPGLTYYRGGSRNNIVEYNIFYGNFYFSTPLDAGADGTLPPPSGNSSNHNLYGNKPVIPTGKVSMGPDEKQGNPNFIDPKSGDFREAITSLYQDRGAFAPPKTSNIQVSGVLDQSAVISWTTDIAADSWMEYGADGGPKIATVSTAGTAHRATVNGLAAGASYTFKIATRDGTGKVQYSDVQNFKTLVPIVLNLSLGTTSVEVNENSALTFTAAATDTNLPAQPLTYTAHLADGSELPAGASFDGNTGIFSWTPGYDQGRTTPYRIVIGVTNGILSTEKTVEVVVKNVNQAPVLASIPDKTANVGTPFSLVVTATDADLPANALAFTLEPGAPEGATIDPVSGAFTWTPTLAQENTTNRISVRVTDNGSPPLSDSKSFTIIVSAQPRVPVQLSVSLLPNGSVKLVWNTTPGRTYTLQRSADLADWQDLITANATDVSLEHVDTEVPTAPARFYRVAQR